MSAGRIAQIGTPRDIYHAPANAFVADFIGTTNRLRHKDATLVFRPEDADLVPPGEGMAQGIIQVVHFLGDRQRVHLHTDDGEAVIVEIGSRRRVAPGQRSGIAVRPEGMVHLSGNAEESAA
nr:TOBE domain-containing protein [Telmatospirillum sp. J64-1]